MTKNRTLILNHKQIQQKINRLAYQIYEDNFDEKELIVIGIAGGGGIFGKRLADALKNICSIRVTHYELQLDKKSPFDSSIHFAPSKDDVSDRVIILVDDVLNSGTTLMYSTKYLLQAKLKKLCTVVLINRNHKRFPIANDYTGLSLATTMKEHVAVEWKTGNDAAYLV